MLWKIIFSVAAAACLAFLYWRLKGILLTPVKPGRNVRLRILITVSGAAPSLEQTVDALLWLRANGTLPAEICIADRGMDAETAEQAAALAKTGKIRIID